MVGPDQRRARKTTLARLTPLVLFGLLALGTVLTLVACTPAADEAVTSDRGAPGLFPIEPAAELGEPTYNLYPIVFWIAVAVFVLVEGWLIWIVLRYRRRRGDDELPAQTHGHNGLEIIWTLIPAAVVALLFVATVDALARIEERVEQPAVEIDVIGFQWQWQFDYPNTTPPLSFIGAGREGPVMALPVNERVRIRLHAQDVIHSFYVPEFLYKRDVIPGRVNEFDVVVHEPGTYGGQCAEFCGLLHADMFFTVEAMTRTDFDAWVAERQREAQQTPAPVPTGAPTIQVTSVSITEGFDPSELSVAADTPFVVELTNADPVAPHDFAVRGANPDGSDWQGDPDAAPSGSATYQAPALTAGDYEFYCSIHPNMIGTLHVGE
ncbi:MAG: cytochrome c oxidase subunit II [Chloroflexota bacterium]|nr:cytochrome c oxidase subunit II [Chloroflexota bacterium]